MHLVTTNNVRDHATMFRKGAIETMMVSDPKKLVAKVVGLQAIRDFIDLNEHSVIDTFYVAAPGVLKQFMEDARIIQNRTLLCHVPTHNFIRQHIFSARECAIALAAALEDINCHDEAGKLYDFADTRRV